MPTDLRCSVCESDVRMEMEEFGLRDWEIEKADRPRRLVCAPAPLVEDFFIGAAGGLALFNYGAVMLTALHDALHGADWLLWALIERVS